MGTCSVGEGYKHERGGRYKYDLHPIPEFSDAKGRQVLDPSFGKITLVIVCLHLETSRSLVRETADICV
jgi:hypothetical protein